MRRALRASLAPAVVAGLVLLGAAPAAADDDGAIRLAHLSPDTPSVDVYVDNVADPGAKVTLPGVGYGAVSDYQELPAGTYTISMRQAGADPATPPAITTTVEVTAGTAQTVAGVGFFADLSLAILDDDLSLPPAGSARVRVVSAAGSASSVDASAGGMSLASGLAFGETGDYVDVPAGPTTLELTPAGGSVMPVPVTMDAGSVYSLLVLDAGGTLGVQTVVDASGMPVVPVGGVETGAGGTAGGRSALPAAVAVLAALGLLGTFGVRMRGGGRHAARR